MRYVLSLSSFVTVLAVVIVILAAVPRCGGELSAFPSEGMQSMSSPSAARGRSRGGGLRRRLFNATAVSAPSAEYSADTKPSSPSTAPTTSLAPTEGPHSPSEWTGALVTMDCVYEGYGYAVDIYWSCGSEKFDRDLRLHTFKRHSRSHGKVFADQLLTMRDGGQLWFDGYDEPRCVYASSSSGAFRLTTAASSCGTFALLPAGETGVDDDSALYLLRDVGTETCATIGGSCGSREDTGGRECGGIRHMYLPLTLGPCDDFASFRIATVADTCASEQPESNCFPP